MLHRRVQGFVCAGGKNNTPSTTYRMCMCMTAMSFLSLSEGSARTMSRHKTYHCWVVGCEEPHISLHRLPATEDQRAQWIHFIFEENVPTTIGKNLYVCANHFTSDCFSNFGQFNTGLATRLFLNPGAVPTIHHQTATMEM